MSYRGREFLFLLSFIGLMNNAVAEDGCATGYAPTKHSVNFTITVDSSTYSVDVAATSSTVTVQSTTFIASEDGYCPDGYTIYSRTDDYIYPILADPDLCAAGYYRANGTCTQYGQGQCPSGRYDSAIVSSTFTASEDGYCSNGYVPYTRTDDYIYPIVVGNDLCPAGQYKASNGTCTSYAQSTCPNNYYSYSLNANTIAQQTNGACPSNYTTYTTMTNCDVNPGNICADIPTVINVNWIDGETTLLSNTCTYNGELTFPEEPTRVGYTFSGWKIMDE